jgi:DNA-binding beta-propeller fold protein YncE
MSHPHPETSPCGSRTAPAIALVLAVVSGGALVGQSKSPARAQGLEAAQTVWPLPPDEPRLRLVGALSRSEDVEGAVKRTRLDGWRTALLGADRTGAARANLRSLGKPYGVAVDAAGRVFVADTERAAVFVFDAAHQRFLTLGGDPSPVTLRIPMGLAVDGRGNIYVGDNGHGAIFAFGPDLNYLGTLTRPGDVEAPTGLAVDLTRDRLYVADTRKHQVSSYNLESGALVRRVGRKGSEPGEFGWPSGIAVGPDSLVYVSDTMNYRVQVFDRDLNFVRSFGSLGVNPGQFRRPKGIAVDQENVVYVVDSDFNNVQMFDTHGQPLLAVGHHGERLGEMLLPAGVAVSGAQRRVYVAEQLTRRIQVFERVGPRAYP